MAKKVRPMRRMLVLSAALTALAAPAVASGNLIVNGGFESNPAATGSYIQYFGGQTFTGWTVTGSDVLNIDSAYQEGSGPPLVFAAHGGSDALDITGAGNTSPADGVSQTIATVAGTTYKVTFWVGNADTRGTSSNLYGSPSTIDLSIDGGSLTPYTNGNINENNIDWMQFSTTFVAAGSLTTIAFSNGTPTSDNYGGLDDVSVTAVPEPATWAMMIVGFGIVGGGMRIRIGKNAQSAA